MVTTSISDDLRSFRRSWVHHTGMQLATLLVLASAFSVIVLFLNLGLNLERLLISWGDGVQVTAYLEDDVGNEERIALQNKIKSMAEVESVAFVPREAATVNFKAQMAAYAPDLLSDADFTHPFPASFRIGLRGGVEGDSGARRLEGFAASLKQSEGVEDVSFGQSWLQTYSSFVAAVTASGGTVILILLAGGLLVVGNSIRASIASRREEIEILELVGATAAMIRRPYVFEGMCMGLLSAALALVANFALHTWQVAVLSRSVALGRIADSVSFLSITHCILFAFAGAALGALGAWFTVRHINDGWSARQRIENSAGGLQA